MLFFSFLLIYFLGQLYLCAFDKDRLFDIKEKLEPFTSISLLMITELYFLANFFLQQNHN